MASLAASADRKAANHLGLQNTFPGCAFPTLCMSILFLSLSVSSFCFSISSHQVKRVIYIDADQVVRADVKELKEMDLEGAPYAYTPFCESREDMDGFRFWKSGYWASHLHGRKYHISALYVVDLQRFRRIAAGDRLRGQYQGLSQDPNSLSNLDQDLPNNMIHQVITRI